MKRPLSATGIPSPTSLERLSSPQPSQQSGTPAAADSNSPRQRRKQARPQELLVAALTVFVEKGFAAARTEEVAKRAGVSKGTLYLYYPSKEDLFKAVVRQNLSQLIAEGAQIVEQHAGSSADLLTQLLHTWWQRVGDGPAGGIHKIVLTEVRNFPELAQFYTDEVVVPAHQLFCRCVQRGIAQGEFRAMPLHEVTLALMAPVIFLAIHRHSFGACPIDGGMDIDPRRVLDAHIDMTLRGLVVRSMPAARRPVGGKPAARKPAAREPADRDPSDRKPTIRKVVKAGLRKAPA